MTVSNDQESVPPPGPRTYGRIEYRTDLSGQRIMVRPNQVLSPSPNGDVLRALIEVLFEVTGERINPEKLAPRAINETWARYEVPNDLFRESRTPDTMRLIRGLRERGLIAQPNHVYFVNSLAAGLRVNPNTFAPNTFAPNTFAPNTFAPNTFAPNTFAPNTFAPHTFAPNTFAGGAHVGGDCCCPEGPDNGTDLIVPRWLARPTAEQPPEAVDELCGEQIVELHVIDIVSVENATDPGEQAGASFAGEVREQPEPVEVLNTDPPRDNFVDPAVGHGDFVRNIAARHSGLDVRLWQAADPLGDIDDAALVAAMQAVDAAAVSRLKVLNLSLSGYNEDDRPGTLLADQVDRMLATGWVIVAAAGNNASCRLAWPAALPGVVAVGAISHCAPAWFSNYGPWVDVSAPGVNIIEELPPFDGLDDEFRTLDVDEVLVVETEDPNDTESMVLGDFDTGCAMWSGTSFSAPLIAGRIARRLQDSGIADVQEAKDDAYDHVFRRNDLDWLPYYGRLVT